MKTYRLHFNDKPIGFTVKGEPEEARLWNDAAMTFRLFRIAHGKNAFPMLQMKEVEDRSQALVYRVEYRENGKDKSTTVAAMSHKEAMAEFEATASVAAKVIKVTPDEDLTVFLKAEKGEKT